MFFPFTITICIQMLLLLSIIIIIIVVIMIGFRINILIYWNGIFCCCSHVVIKLFFKEKKISQNEEEEKLITSQNWCPTILIFLLFSFIRNEKEKQTKKQKKITVWQTNKQKVQGLFGWWITYLLMFRFEIFLF